MALSTGAKVAIVITSIVTLGAGGFALWWIFGRERKPDDASLALPPAASLEPMPSQPQIIVTPRYVEYPSVPPVTLYKID